MKKFAMFLMVLMMMMVCEGYAEQYILVGVVVEFDFENDLVIVEDCTGEQWAFEGIEDWWYNDLAGMLMDDNGTKIIYDDIILLVTYCGNIEQWNIKEVRVI